MAESPIRKRLQILGSIGREFDAINGKHLLADEVHLVTDKQDRKEEPHDLFIQCGNKIGDGGEMRYGIAGEGHEDDILLATLLYLPGRDNAP